jgi:hypothetical protein
MPDSTDSIPARQTINEINDKHYADHLRIIGYVRNFILVFMGAYLSITLSGVRILPDNYINLDMLTVTEHIVSSFLLLSGTCFCGFSCYIASYRDSIKEALLGFSIIMIILSLWLIFGYPGISLKIEFGSIINTLAFLWFWLACGVFISYMTSERKNPGQVDRRDELISNLQRLIQDLEQPIRSRR